MSTISGTDKFCLKWNDFESNVSTAFQELREDRDFFDVTLACDGNQLEAHKVILAACSSFFRGVLKRNPHNHPLLYLKGIKYEDILAVVNFMYHGEVNIAQSELTSFLSVAEDLQVKGLTKSASTSSPSPTKRPPESHRSQRQKPLPPPPPHIAPSSRSSYDSDQQSNVIEVPGIPCSVKTEPHQSMAVDVVGGEEEGGMVEYGGGELVPEAADVEEKSYQGAEFHDYKEEMAQALSEGTTGNDRNILLKYITKVVNRDGCGEDQFKCDVCGKIGGRKDNVLNHVETIHFPGTFDYKCTRCMKSMPTKKALENHVYRNHRDDPMDLIVETQYVN